MQLVREIDIYHNHPMRDFSQTHEILRIRRSNMNTITYKGPVFSQQTKARIEYNCTIENPEIMSKILQALGFEQWKIVSKSREIWKSNHACINLDHVNSLGKFVEVEILSSNRKNSADTQESLFLVVKKLGFNSNQITTKSYIELIRERPLKSHHNSI